MRSHRSAINKNLSDIKHVYVEVTYHDWKPAIQIGLFSILILIEFLTYESVFKLSLTYLDDKQCLSYWNYHKEWGNKIPISSYQFLHQIWNFWESSQVNQSEMELRFFSCLSYLVLIGGIFDENPTICFDLKAAISVDLIISNPNKRIRLKPT